MYIHICVLCVITSCNGSSSRGRDGRGPRHVKTAQNNHIIISSIIMFIISSSCFWYTYVVRSQGGAELPVGHAWANMTIIIIIIRGTGT